VSVHVLLSLKDRPNADAYEITLFTSGLDRSPLTTLLPRINFHILETVQWTYSIHRAEEDMTAGEQDFVQWANSQTERDTLCIPVRYVTEHLKRLLIEILGHEQNPSPNG
jgi:hypothetical protein